MVQFADMDPIWLTEMGIGRRKSLVISGGDIVHIDWDVEAGTEDTAGTSHGLFLPTISEKEIALVEEGTE